MPVQMIELEEVMMVEASDEDLEAEVLGGTSTFSSLCPITSCLPCT